jgi:hypothetical protein
MWAIVSIVGIWAPCLIDLWYGVLDSRMGFVVCAAMPFVLCGTIVSLITLPELFDKLSSQKGRYKWEIAFVSIIFVAPTFLGVLFIGINILISLLRF